jgi:hypothetical protein
MTKLADQVLEPIRKRMTLVKEKWDTPKSFCSLHFSANLARKNPRDLLISD